MLAALIPLFGWIVVGPMMLVTLILGVVVMAKGGIGQGIAIALCAVLLLPLFTIAITGAALIGASSGM